MKDVNAVFNNLKEKWIIAIQSSSFWDPLSAYYWEGVEGDQEYWELTNENVGQASSSSFLIFRPQLNNISDNYPAKVVLKKMATKLFKFVEKAWNFKTPLKQFLSNNSLSALSSNCHHINKFHVLSCRKTRINFCRGENIIRNIDRINQLSCLSFYLEEI